MLRKLFPRKGVYYGPVVFVAGAHYPVGKDGHPSLSQRVLWNAADGVYEWAKPADPTHAHLYHSRTVELETEPS